MRVWMWALLVLPGCVVAGSPARADLPQRLILGIVECAGLAQGAETGMPDAGALDEAVAGFAALAEEGRGPTETDIRDSYLSGVQTGILALRLAQDEPAVGPMGIWRVSRALDRCAP